MTEGSATSTAQSADAMSGGKPGRDQSTIQFPYGDLADGISVATALMSCGGVPCDPDQLAAAMNQTPSSGSFRTKIATARVFGLIETVHGKYELTDLGFAVTDSTREKAAKVDAFLRVPLYKAVYEKFRNQQLPPRPLPLEHAFVGLGVAPKQKDRARHAFDRSAQLAGFFDTGGRDRLIRPPVGTTGAIANDPPPISSPQQQQHREPEQNRFRSGGGGNGGGYHPFVQGLLQTLPEPGTVWTVEGRAAWLEAAASAFKLIYQGDGRIKIAAENEVQ